MRASLFVAAVLLLGAAAITFFLSQGEGSPFVRPSPPGQYPLNELRPEWPAKRVVREYRPIGA